jgi:uncharacterized protein
VGAGFWDFALGALGLMLVAEGFLPFFSPAAWRIAFERALRFSDGQLRFLGLFCMVAGLVLLFFVIG